MTLLSALLHLWSWPQALSSNPREEACLSNPLSALSGLSVCLSISLPLSLLTDIPGLQLDGNTCFLQRSLLSPRLGEEDHSERVTH